MWEQDGNKIFCGDASSVMRSFPEKSVNCCVTSPPYWGLRDYKTPPVTFGDGWTGHLGLEPTPELYVQHTVEIFREVRRVLRDDGTLWLNLGDSYATGAEKACSPGGGNHRYKPKDLVGIPWMVAFALRADGWYLRQDIIWYKPNPMPESVNDRCTKAHEYIFLMSKSQRYYYDKDEIAENQTKSSLNRQKYGWNGNENRSYTKGKQNNMSKYCEKTKKSGTLQTTRNKRSVWQCQLVPYIGAHYATFPLKLIEPCILAGCPVGGTVLDPFFGAGTTGLVAYKNNRKFIGIDLSERYCLDNSIPRIEKEMKQLKLFPR